MMANIVQLFLNCTEKYPDQVAIVYRDASVTYQDLRRDVEQTASYFQSKGIKPGDRVLVFVPMSIDLYRTVLALFYIGATAVFLDEWVSKKRMELCCSIADCSAFVGVFKARVFAYFSKGLRKIPIRLGTGMGNGVADAPVIFNPNPDQAALITFTTGSTGTPKAAKRTHKFLGLQFNALLSEIDPKPEDIDMCVLPIVLFCNLGAGSTSVIADFQASKPDRLNPERVYNQIVSHGVTRITASPFFVKKLSEFISNTNKPTPVLEKIFTGGAPVFPREAEIYERAFPNTHVKVVYGSTEAEPISSINVKQLIGEGAKQSVRGLNVGKVYSGSSVKIVGITDEVISCTSDKELSKLERPLGSIGEIIVAGEHVLKEYYNNPEALKRNKIFVGDEVWHRTGDAGYIDDGLLFLTGRCNRMIK